MAGLDTIHIVFGSSALKTLLGLAGVEPKTASTSASPNATLEGIQNTLEVASKIHHVNVASTAAVLSTFIPLLQLTSPSPSIVLLSSMAALVPPPTRALYAASKAAQLQLFQAVAIESQAQSGISPQRKAINFLAIAPGTIRTAFRLSALDTKLGTDDDKSPVVDSSWDKGSKNKGSSDILEPEQVAFASIKAADRMESGIKTMPAKYKFVPFVQLIA